MESSTQVANRSPRQRGFRWRTVPVTVLATFGGLFVLAGLFSFFTMAYSTSAGRPLYMPGPSGYSQLGVVIGIWGIACGSLLVVSSRLWWNGRWRLALLIVGFCIGTVQVLRATGMMPD